MKNSLALIALFVSLSLTAQEKNKDLKLSLQTDLAAYTTPGGWSVWSVAQLNQNRLALAFVNYPNRFRDIYDETGIKETDRFARLQLARHFKPTSKLKHLFVGMNVEYHWRELEEDNNSSEILNDTHLRVGLFIGYDWYPWHKKENILQNLSLTPWVGINLRPNSTNQVRVFENTGNVYAAPNAIAPAFGLNVGYTFFSK